jgi:hypothetical protein
MTAILDSELASSRRAFLQRLALGGSASALVGCGPGVDRVAQAARDVRRPLDVEAADPVPELVRAATLAANSHNTQPWRFRRHANGLTIAADFSRRTPAVDPDDHHLFASLGCAAENLAIAAGALGRKAEVSFGSEEREVLVALNRAPVERTPLTAAIFQRQSTRSIFDGRIVSNESLRALEAAAAGFSGVRMILLTARSEIDRVRDFVVEGNRRQMADAAFVSELRDWIRFDAARALETGDGLFSAASGNPTLLDPLGRMIFGLVFTEDAETRRYRAQLDSSSGVALFVAERADAEHWVQVGRAYQRWALQATALGLKHAFVNQPVEVPDMRAEFARAFGVGDVRVDLILRFGFGNELPFSLRRPVTDVLSG